MIHSRRGVLRLLGGAALLPIAGTVGAQAEAAEPPCLPPIEIAGPFVRFYSVYGREEYERWIDRDDGEGWQLEARAPQLRRRRARS